MIAMAARENDYTVIDGVELSNLKPLPHHVLIRWPGKKETRGGLIIPENRERLGLMNGEILLVGSQCDERLAPGIHVQFSFNCEKEFLGAQCPGDRDPVFFMREEALIGITVKDDAGHVRISLLNGCVLTKPELRPEEVAGLITVNHEARDAFFCWGLVAQIDAKAQYDFRVGDVVGYTRNQAEELKLSSLEDSEAPVMHVLLSAMGSVVQAVREAI